MDLQKRSLRLNQMHLSGINLKQREYQCYASIEEFTNRGRQVDIIYSRNVIEHVENPVEFILAQKKILPPGGILIVSTPNLDNFLMKFGPEEYKAFFFRKAHRWYFNAHSLKFFLNQIGMTKIQFKYQQRYGLSNTLLWMRDRKPSGNLDNVNNVMCDMTWKHFLEQTGQTEHILCMCEQPS